MDYKVVCKTYTLAILIGLKTFSTKFHENLSVGDELFRADGQTRRQT